MCENMNSQTQYIKNFSNVVHRVDDMLDELTNYIYDNYPYQSSKCHVKLLEVIPTINHGFISKKLWRRNPYNFNLMSDAILRYIKLKSGIEKLRSIRSRLVSMRQAYNSANGTETIILCHTDAEILGMQVIELSKAVDYWMENCINEKSIKEIVSDYDLDRRLAHHRDNYNIW